MAYRLYASIMELKKLEGILGNESLGSQIEEDFDEYYERFLSAYDEVVVTLPALADLRKSIDSTTVGVYNLWKDLKSIRSKQGFTATRTRVFARKVQQQLTGEPEVASRSEGGPEDDATLWALLSTEFGSLIALVESSRGIILSQNSKKHQSSTSDLESLSTDLTATMVARKQSALHVKEMERLLNLIR